MMLPGTFWAITDTTAKSLIYHKGSCLEFSAEDLQTAGRRQAGLKLKKAVTGGVALIDVFGIIQNRPDFWESWGFSISLETVSACLDRALADNGIGAIILNIDSPGGTLTGVPEFSEKIYEARGRKPIFALANSMAASAAYWLASAADAVYATPSALVGSIGVYGVHTDVSEAEKMAGIKITLISAGQYKTEGSEHKPLSDGAKSYMQSMVDEYYDTFICDVARNRGVSAATVRSKYGKGRILTAKNALQAGIVDGIMTKETLLAKLVGSRV